MRNDPRLTETDVKERIQALESTLKRARHRREVENCRNAISAYTAFLVELHDRSELPPAG